MSSTPPTPARSSRASSAASTPAMRASKSPIELTPRSKVKAMLAAAGMSDDSEDELSTKLSNGNSKPSESAPNLAPANAKSAHDDTSSDSDDDDVVLAKRPVGRMAARMLAQEQNDENGSGEDDGNAYQRVKKMLQSAKDQKKDSSHRSRPVPDAESSSGEDMLFNRRPANARRSARNTTESPKASASAASRASSPGLFMSPSKPSPTRPASSHDLGSDSDSDMANFQPKSRLEELVAKKRAERKAKEAAEKKDREENHRRAKAEARKSRQIEAELNGSETDSNDDEGVAEKLTQQSRPTRRAGKKAMEEMNRETQRIARNMQLTHQATTKKKYTTQDLFKRFNFGQPKESSQEKIITLASSDVDQVEKETPPTSPPDVADTLKKTNQQQVVDSNGFSVDTVIDIGQDEDVDVELPTLKDDISQQKKIDKGKGRAVSPSIEGAAQVVPAKPTASVLASEKKIRTFRVVLPERPAGNVSDSDEDLEIVRDTRFPVFDNLPARKAQEPTHLLRLRHLAHLTSPSKNRQTGKNSMSPAELQAVLQRRAREQAKAEREEKIAELRAKGILVQTEEERERDQLELENLLEKARQEAEELAKKEKSEAKKNGEDEGDGFPDSDDDESYVEGASHDEGGDDEEIELSGSEEEEGEEDEDEEEREGDGLLDNEADEEDDEMQDEQAEAQPLEDAADDVESEHEEDAPVRRTAAARNRKRVVEDEDEEDTEPKLHPAATEHDPMAAFGFANNAAPQPPENSTQDDMMAAFGFANNDAPVGLSQMFAGTMAEVDSQAEMPIGVNSQQDSLDFLRKLPVSTIPEFPDPNPNDSQDSVIRDSLPPASQSENTGNDINIGISQFPSQPDFPDTQMSDMPDPTQDGGFEVSRTPGRFNKVTPAPSSTQRTIDTVILDAEAPESPLVRKKKGRLQRRREIVSTALSDLDEDPQSRKVDAASEAGMSDEEFEISADAFDVLRKGAKRAKKIDAFNKKNSAAKEMVQEQAEESEDEYAGLGGASDDESGGEMDEDLKKMIDESKVKVNEREIAAFYADKERAEDEKRIDKLYKDITNGNLRRKRGGGLDDLDDSDDEAAERRARKQREFARMRKALLEDEKIGKIAENPKKLAFLRAIEDHDDDEDFSFLDDNGNEEEQQSQSIADSQEAAKQDAEEVAPTAQPTTTTTTTENPLKRKATGPAHDENRPPARQRRTLPAPDRKPTTLAEIRESVSFLIDEPLVRETQFSASEDEGEEDEPPITRTSFAERRNTTKLAVVDRLTLSRENSAASDSTSRPLAFAAGNKPVGSSGFRVPSLLKRATTNLSTTSTTSNTSNGSTGGGATDAGLRRGGSKKSNIHYQAREAERKRVVEAAEMRREEGLRKKVVMGKKRSVLGVLGKAGGGGFE
ncbi:MRC1-like domain-containing protein [Macrophomina phaseolina]|uniref:MRC1-like domain-containing protein n=1 Tax=Macrophomina phaseolina TaxID=35725 RepID=A0ABQ8GQR4_9PEZI|nr:MRC1-like domain-containing protein [Macrophomina phaseolina]